MKGQRKQFSFFKNKKSTSQQFERQSEEKKPAIKKQREEMQFSEEQWRLIEKNRYIEISKEQESNAEVKMLIEAIELIDYNLAEELINNNAAILSYKNTITKLTPLSVAVMNKNLTMVDFLIKQGASVNGEIIDGVDVTWLAMLFNHSEMLDLLLQNGAKKEFKYEEKTRLMKSVELSQLENVEILLKHKVNVNAKDKNGRTALHFAFLKENFSEKDLRICELLIEAGADLQEADSEGIKPHEYGTVKDVSLSHIFNLIQKHGLNYVSEGLVRRLESIYRKEGIRQIDYKKEYGMSDTPVAAPSLPKKPKILGGF